MSGLPVRAILALGSNLGERAGTLASAVADLVEHPQVRLCDVSRWCRPRRSAVRRTSLLT